MQYKNQAILDYLYKNYYNRKKIDTPQKESDDNNWSGCIWTAWLQGEENAPEVIQLTIASMRRYANNHRVIVLTNDNVDSFIQIPAEIKKKHSDGSMGHAHYADVIRMIILAKYGGIWLDATMILHEPINEEAFTTPFFSIGFDSEKKAQFVSDHKWIVRFMGGCKNSKYLFDIASMLTDFWKEHSIPIDYFVFDYIIAVLYQNDISFRNIVDHLEKQNRFTYELGKYINEPFNDSILKDLFSQKDVYTLSYRQQYQKQTAEGLLTCYGYLYNQYFEK